MAVCERCGYAHRNPSLCPQWKLPVPAAEPFDGHEHEWVPLTDCYGDTVTDKRGTPYEMCEHCWMPRLSEAGAREFEHCNCCGGKCVNNLPQADATGCCYPLGAVCPVHH